MGSQKFTHENEVMAAAPLSKDEDGELFAKQDVWLSPSKEVRWDFVLHNGMDWHFAQKLVHLPDDLSLRAFKEYIRHVLK